MTWLRVFILVFLIPGLAFAEGEQPSTYAPEFCEFSITFPSEPYKTQRCEDEEKTRCYQQISYTKVFDLSSTVNFRVICNPIGEEVKKSYSGEVMQATLGAMTDRSVVQTFETSFREEEHYKQAGLVGEGKVGRTATLYIAQLWIGEKSALSVEAELIGEAIEKADSMFSDILRSVHYVTEAEKKEQEEKESKDGEDGEDVDDTEDSSSEEQKAP